MNIRDYDYTQWQATVSYCNLRGIKVIPWARLAHIEHGETITTVRHWLDQLIFAAILWGCDTIMPNYEKEAETISPAEVIEQLDQTIWEGNVGWSMQGWVPNGVDYSPITIRNHPVLLQIFPADMYAIFPDDTRHDPEYVAKVTGDCVYHARMDKGFQYVGVTWQTYGDMRSGDFDCHSFQHSTFPGNLLARQDWAGWYQ